MSDRTQNWNMIMPLQDGVLILPDENKYDAISGLYYENNKMQTGTVVAIGDGDLGKEKIQMLVKKQQRVIYESVNAKIISNGTNTYHIIKQSDLLGVITNNE